MEVWENICVVKGVLPQHMFICPLSAWLGVTLCLIFGWRVERVTVLYSWLSSPPPDCTQYPLGLLSNALCTFWWLVKLNILLTEKSWPEPKTQYKNVHFLYLHWLEIRLKRFHWLKMSTMWVLLNWQEDNNRSISSGQPADARLEYQQPGPDTILNEVIIKECLEWTLSNPQTPSLLFYIKQGEGSIYVIQVCIKIAGGFYLWIISN